jgi:hypothetical protein
MPLTENIPIPDPSLLTTDQLRRELAALRDTLETRLNAMDKASILLHDNLSLVPTGTDKQISHLKELHEAKIDAVGTNFHGQLTAAAAGIEKQFVERDVRSKAAELAAQVAVGAALQAQKESANAMNESNAVAVAKAEATTVKQIDGILALLTSNTKNTDDKIAVINARLDRDEGANRGHNSSQTSLLAIMAVIISIIVGGFAIFSVMHTSPSPTVVSPAVIPLNK